MNGPSERAVSVSLLWPREQRKPAVVPAQTVLESDERLMELVRGRDKDALGKLYSRFSRLVFSIGRRILQDNDEAEEIVQEVFLQLYEKPTFDPQKGGARAWIVGMAFNRALEHRRFLATKNFRTGTSLDAVVDTLAGGLDLERDLAVTLSREQLRKAFAELADKQRRVLELTFFEGMDLREISACLNEPYPNVRHAYHRGVENLRKSAFVQGQGKL
jgi:RNA polymerase sigma-70 factor, ECF subfamily